MRELTAYTNDYVANTRVIGFSGELHLPILQLGASYGLSSLSLTDLPPPPRCNSFINNIKVEYPGILEYPSAKKARTPPSIIVSTIERNLYSRGQHSTKRL